MYRLLCGEGAKKDYYHWDAHTLVSVKRRGGKREGIANLRNGSDKDAE